MRGDGHHGDAGAGLEGIGGVGIQVGHDDVRRQTENVLVIGGAVVSGHRQGGEQLPVKIAEGLGDGGFLLSLLHAYHQVLGLEIDGVAQSAHAHAHHGGYLLRQRHLAAAGVGDGAESITGRLWDTCRLGAAGR